MLSLAKLSPSWLHLFVEEVLIYKMLTGDSIKVYFQLTNFRTVGLYTQSISSAYYPTSILLDIMSRTVG